MRRLAVFSYLCAILIATRAFAAPPSDARAAKALDATIDAYAANGDFSGVVFVTRHGKQVFEKTVGLASAPFDQPNRPDTRFLLASVTKTFTAAGIALLEKDGKLKIEDPLNLSLPDFAPADKIRIWHLLGHQSGLDNPDYDAIAARAVSPDDLLGMIAAKPLLFEPGSQTRYSNAGYIVLARVIEKLGGQAFGDFLAARIFKPLGMTSTGTLESGEIVPALAEGTIPGVGTAIARPEPRDPSSLYGSGNVYSTAGDLDRWLTAVDTHTLFDITRQPYPFGWGKRTWFDKAVLVQSGIANGYCSVILTVPEDALHIVVLMNIQSGFTGDEGKSLLGAFEGQSITPPARRGAPARVAPETLAKFAGLYAWGDYKIPMHIAWNGKTLTLRWADSASVAVLTPLGDTDFLDRSSFGTIHFQDGGLVWTQNGEKTNASRASE
jgi:CubicO group peptidase (beta-lactamase class C family)